MFLSARMLNNVVSVNDWEYTDAVRFTEGDSVFVYFQLIDLNKDRLEQRISPPGKRYMPDSGAMVQVSIQNIDAAKTLSKIATQPFPEDPSIWRIEMLSTDSIKGTFALQLTLTEGIVVTRGTTGFSLNVVGTTAAYC